VNTFAQYRDYVTGGDVGSEQEIANGSGAILRDGLSKIACYRDDGGCLHKLSAMCPHLGGIVRWNDAEKTWDCPAHGSRFTALGEVVNGPANSGLKPIGEEDKAA
jgi:Rieske Fe-S protein